MALHAHVPCNCVARGLAKPAPIELTLEDSAAWPPHPLHHAELTKLVVWAMTACSHRDMLVAHGEVDWASVHALRDALAAVGEPVSTLLRELPTATPDVPDPRLAAVTAPKARICLDELSAFRRVCSDARHERALAILENLFGAAALHDTCVVWC